VSECEESSRMPGEPPKTLDETYERILLSTDEEYRDVIVEAFRCYVSLLE
jgi:hypothetical protein